MPSQYGSAPEPVVEYLWQIAELWYGPMLLEQWESSREILDFQRLWDVTLSAFVIVIHVASCLFCLSAELPVLFSRPI